MDNIILYSQPGCQQCKMVHLLLDKHNIHYESCQDMDEMLKLGLRHTPVLSVNGVFLVGADIRDYIQTGKIPEAK